MCICVFVIVWDCVWCCASLKVCFSDGTEAETSFRGHGGVEEEEQYDQYNGGWNMEGRREREREREKE